MDYSMGYDILDLGKILKKEPSLALVWGIIRLYCETFDIDDVKENLAIMLTAVVDTPDSAISSEERSNVLWLYKNLKVINAAVFYLQTQLLLDKSLA
jgi:hypothetical protein